MEKITINGKNFNLDVARATELGVLEPVSVAKIGQKYKRLNSDYYILALVDYYKIALINLTSGHRWAETTDVHVAASISNIEWNNVCGGVPNDFVLVK